MSLGSRLAAAWRAFQRPAEDGWCVVDEWLPFGYRLVYSGLTEEEACQRTFGNSAATGQPMRCMPYAAYREQQLDLWEGGRPWKAIGLLLKEANAATSARHVQRAEDVRDFVARPLTREWDQ